MDLISNILDFITQYWRELISLVILLISVLISLFRKRSTLNVADEIKKDVLVILPEMIKAVECAGHGQDKLNAVVLEVKKYIKKKYSVKDVDVFIPFIISSIESILSTPTKKER